jgi:hypothetical protein
MRRFIAMAILLGGATAGFAGEPHQDSLPAKKPFAILKKRTPLSATPTEAVSIPQSESSDPSEEPRKWAMPTWTSFKKIFTSGDEETLSAESREMPTAKDILDEDGSKNLVPARADEQADRDIPMASKVGDMPMSSMKTDAGTATSSETILLNDATVAPSTMSRVIAQRPGYGWYGRSEFVYWTATDPKPVGSAFNLFSGADTVNLTPTTPTLGQIRIDDPNTDHEMGFRNWLGAHYSDRLAFEWGTLWVNPSSYVEEFRSQPPASTGFSSTQGQTVRLATTNEPLVTGDMSWRNRFWGTEINGRYHLLEGPIWSLDSIAGLRYFQYSERLVFAYERPPASTPAAIIRERFYTDNNLIGPHIGGDLKLRLLEYVTWNTGGRVGLMANLEQLVVRGPSPGSGRFTNASNLGTRSTADFSPLFEVNSGLTLELTPAITFQAGYTIMWIGNLLRSTEQVDLARIGGSPVVGMNKDDIWIRGFTGTITYKW